LLKQEMPSARGRAVSISLITDTTSSIRLTGVRLMMGASALTRASYAQAGTGVDWRRRLPVLTLKSAASR